MKKKAAPKKQIGKKVKRQSTHPNLRRGGPGRPKGVPNKATQEWKEICRRLIYDEEVQQNLLMRLRQGKADKVFVLLCHYAIGVPKQPVSLEGPEGKALRFTLTLDEHGDS